MVFCDVKLCFQRFIALLAVTKQDVAELDVSKS